MTYDPKCHDLAAMFLEDEVSLNTKKNGEALAQVIQNAIENWIEDEHVANDDCICGWSAINSASEEPPHRVVNKHCPLHGNAAARDPDAEYERRRDDAIDRPPWEDE